MINELWTYAILIYNISPLQSDILCLLFWWQSNSKILLFSQTMQSQSYNLNEKRGVGAAKKIRRKEGVQINLTGTRF